MNSKYRTQSKHIELFLVKPEGMSNYKSTINVSLAEERNEYEVQQIMGICVTTSLRNQYTNEDVLFMV